jgi:chromosome transmission fidelity protein 1
LTQKLLGFQNKENDADENSLSKHVSAMGIVQTFLDKLTYTSKEGKIVMDPPTVNEPDPMYRYVLLSPASFFQNVLDEAHALALVGGTLRPFVHVAAELLGDPDIIAEAKNADSFMAQQQHSMNKSARYMSSSFTAFTCDHVVSPSNVLLQCLSTGPTKLAKLDFRHASRSTDAVCNEQGSALVALCKSVPNGVVVFLPSYSYEAHLTNLWKRTGIWNELKALKKIHREPKKASGVEAALEVYAKDASQGALLFSVMGGKLSEGINFANEKCRCVVVVGLPYP